MPAAISVPVSEFESPKLKTAWKLKWMDLAEGKQMVMMMRIRRIHVLVAMAMLLQGGGLKPF